MFTLKAAKFILSGMLAAILPTALASSALPNAAAHAPSAEACLDKQQEDRLKAREVALLGQSHAEEHAETRARRCMLALGLAKEEAAPAAQANPVAPELAGQWSAPFNIPVAGITTVLLNNGNVLFWAYDPAHYHDPDNSNTGLSYLWDPVSRAGTFLTTPENIWCGGQTILADGRVFLAGGNLRYPDPKAPPGEQGWKGGLGAYTFNPLTSSFVRQPDMAKGRWYPTVTQLGDNTAIITSGYDETGSEQVNQIVERFTASPDMNGVGVLAGMSVRSTTGLYPFQYLLPSGAMLQAGPERSSSNLLQPGAWAWTRLSNLLYEHGGYANGISYTDASAQPVSQLIMIAGGQTGSSNNEWLDSYNVAAGWHDYPKWNTQRHNANTVILPDGKLLTVGGNSANSNYGGTLFSAELYSGPASDPNGAWIEVAPHSIPAAYHSSAILLPDATVLLSEDDSDLSALAAAKHRVQVYSPPYLFRGPRPTFSAPAQLVRGQPFAITATMQASRIAGAVLIAPAAVTHGNDMHQRFIKLPLTAEGGAITATVPASSALAPPGYYMLFIVDAQGVPSTAQFVHVT